MNTRNTTLYLLSLVVVAAASSWITGKMSAGSGLTDESVYLIGSVTVTDPERLPEYQQIAGPLAARSGGYVPLAHNQPNMIEGELPATGSYFIERYESIEGLNRFINSPEFQQAKKFRDEVAEVHFMMWIPAIPAGSLPH